MHSAESLTAARWDAHADPRVLSPPPAIEPKMGRASPDWQADQVNIEIWPGTAYPLGATYDGSGTNFALFS